MFACPICWNIILLCIWLQVYFVTRCHERKFVVDHVQHNVTQHKLFNILGTNFINVMLTGNFDSICLGLYECVRDFRKQTYLAVLFNLIRNFLMDLIYYFTRHSKFDIKSILAIISTHFCPSHNDCVNLFSKVVMSQWCRDCIKILRHPVES